MLFQVHEDLAAIPAATADINNFLRIAGLKHQALLVRLSENVQCLFHGDHPSKAVTFVVVRPPPEDERGVICC